MRLESSFYTGLAPAKGNKWREALLIFKNQMLYPLAQGFLWALAKDWLVVIRLFSTTQGRVLGSTLRAWLGEWIGFALNQKAIAN